MLNCNRLKFEGPAWKCVSHFCVMVQTFLFLGFFSQGVAASEVESWASFDMVANAIVTDNNTILEIQAGDGNCPPMSIEECNVKIVARCSPGGYVSMDVIFKQSLTRQTDGLAFFSLLKSGILVVHETDDNVDIVGGNSLDSMNVIDIGNLEYTRNYTNFELESAYSLIVQFSINLLEFNRVSRKKFSVFIEFFEEDSVNTRYWKFFYSFDTLLNSEKNRAAVSLFNQFCGRIL